MIDKNFSLGLLETPGCQSCSVVSIHLLLHCPCVVNNIGIFWDVVSINNFPSTIFQCPFMFMINQHLPFSFIRQSHGLIKAQHFQLVCVVNATSNTYANTTIFISFQQLNESKIIISFRCRQCSLPNFFY